MKHEATGHLIKWIKSSVNNGLNTSLSDLIKKITPELTQFFTLNLTPE